MLYSKATYDSVPRDKFIKLVEEKLPRNLSNMIAATLKELKYTPWETKTTRTLKTPMGVTQCSPLSTTLFSVYMNTLIKQLREAKRALAHTYSVKTEDYMISLFADDTK